jgi:hypothetical protein
MKNYSITESLEWLVGTGDRDGRPAHLGGISDSVMMKNHCITLRGARGRAAHLDPAPAESLGSLVGDREGHAVSRTARSSWARPRSRRACGGAGSPADVAMPVRRRLPPDVVQRRVNGAAASRGCIRGCIRAGICADGGIESARIMTVYPLTYRCFTPIGKCCACPYGHTRTTGFCRSRGT